MSTSDSTLSGSATPPAKFCCISALSKLINFFLTQLMLKRKFLFSLKITAYKGFRIQWILLNLQFVQTVCTLILLLLLFLRKHSVFFYTFIIIAFSINTPCDFFDKTGRESCILFLSVFHFLFSILLFLRFCYPLLFP